MALLLVVRLKLYVKFKIVTFNGQLRKSRGTRVFNNVSTYLRRALVREQRPKWHRAKFRVHKIKGLKPVEQFANAWLWAFVLQFLNTGKDVRIWKRT